METTVEDQFSCKNCGEVTKQSDYGQLAHLYKNLKEQELCETCAKMTEEDRKEYAMGKRLAKAMVKHRREVLDRDIARLEGERKALDSMSPKDLALQVLKEKPKRELE